MSVRNVKVLLILPAYNEEKNILHTVQQIENAVFPETLRVDYIVINDGSTDRTEELCHKNHIPCISLVQNLGIGGAVQSGYLYAAIQHYDIAVQFDGDGQHDIHSLEALVMPLIAGECDFTVGSRFLDETSVFRSTWLRRIGIRYLSAVIRFMTHQNITDVTSGYRAANRQVIQFFSENYPVDYPEPETLVHLYKNHFRIREVPVNMFPRQEGKSSISFLKSMYYMLKVTFSILCAAVQRENKRKI